mmetsp:Transcript_13409/g.25618  ORF Transcript_13409/g.25618 Transcript_13409/m.25618 type:complete len:210 (+) Transcript_13409:150-779(+)
MRRLHSEGIPRIATFISRSVAAETTLGRDDLRYMMKSNTTLSLPMASSARFGVRTAASALSNVCMARNTVSLVPSCPLNLLVPNATTCTTATMCDSSASLTDGLGPVTRAACWRNRASSERQNRAKKRHGVHVKQPSSSITSRPRADLASGTRKGVEPPPAPLGEDAGEDADVTMGLNLMSPVLVPTLPVESARSMVGVRGCMLEDDPC